MTEIAVYYTYQCNRCFIVSGYSGKTPEDAPTCCGGEPTRPIRHEIKRKEKVKNGR